MRLTAQHNTTQRVKRGRKISINEKLRHIKYDTHECNRKQQKSKRERIYFSFNSRSQKKE